MFGKNTALSKKTGRPAVDPGAVFRYEELEPRVLFSADAVPALDLAAADEVATAAADEGEQPRSEEAAETAAETLSESRLELVIVNDNVPDYEQLISGLQGGDGDRLLEIVLLDSERDGIEQISEILAARSDLAAVHFILHGSEGEIELGNTTLNGAALRQNSEALAAWGRALTESGDFLFYGCDLAKGGAGQSLVNSIAALAGVDVAASDDPTGHQSLGGDWDLEYAAGAIETASPIAAAAQESWEHLLGTHTISDYFEYSGSPYNNHDGTVAWSDAWQILNGTGGYDAVLFTGGQLSIGGDDDVDDIVNYGAQRQATLPTAESATLSLDVTFTGGEQHDYGVRLLVSNTGLDGSWVTLNTFYLNSSLDAGDQQAPLSIEEDISSYCGGTIWVRLIGIQQGDDSDFDPLGDSASIDFDNLIISYTTANDAPTVAAVDLGSINEDNPITITQAQLLTGSSDPDGDPLTAVNLALNTGSGTITDHGDGTWTFTPTPNWNGAVSFGFDVSDGTATTANTASLTVNPVNDAPVLDSAALTVSEGETVTLSNANFGITDPDDTDFTYTLSAENGGFFQLSTNPGTAITSFTTAELSGGLVQ
ncbi:MAG: DUF4347 domain-containing protein, partial [Deltaproteobacteria bacterium]|nr:DUF4347 domain-containing protein [Deltaproteobacteria bacterium]